MTTEQIRGLKVYEEIPPNWDVMRGPVAAPHGFTVICSRERGFTRLARRGLIRNERLNSISGIRVYHSIPAGWSILQNATTAPCGYVFIWNHESFFNGRRKHGLISAEKVRQIRANKKNCS